MKNTMEITYLPHYDNLPPIGVNDVDDAGIDLRAAIYDTITLEVGDYITIPSGIKMHIGSHEAHLQQLGSFMLGIYGCILPRSGLGFKHFVRLANTAGVIDAGFTDEIMIKIRNEGDVPLTIERGDRICQMVFHTYVAGVKFEEVEEFSATTQRGGNGFGNSGVK